jgi:hypothetical protein
MDFYLPILYYFKNFIIMEKEEKQPKKAVSEPLKSLPLEDKGLKTLQEKFLQDNTKKFKEEEKEKCKK